MSCTGCPVGKEKESNAASAACVDCAYGKYADESGSTCTACATGKFVDLVLKLMDKFALICEYNDAQHASVSEFLVPSCLPMEIQGHGNATLSCTTTSNPRFELFKISKGSGHHEINFLFSMVELYRGELLDLFRDKKNNKKNKNSKPINVVN